MTLACWITSTRFIFAPFVYWRLAEHTSNGLIWGIILLLTAGFTDVLDGWAARSRQEISELGKTLDPLADKLLIVAVLAALVKGWGLPSWVLAIYCIKEAIQVMAGYFLLRRFHQLIPANHWGKAATVLFFSGFTVYFFEPDSGVWGKWIIIAAFILSVYAFYTYYQAYKRLCQP